MFASFTRKLFISPSVWDTCPRDTSPAAGDKQPALIKGLCPLELAPGNPFCSLLLGQSQEPMREEWLTQVQSMFVQDELQNAARGCDAHKSW